MRRCPAFALGVCALVFFGLPAGATVINLTTSHTATGVGGTCVGVATDTCGIFVNVDAQSTGTGVIDPFYTVQANGTEQGFNTDAPGSSPDYDMKRGSGTAFTQAIRVSDFGLVDVNGNPCNGCATPYIRFALDINESGGNNDEFLSIDTLQIWVKGTNDTTSTTFAALTASGATKIYDLDGLNANVVYTDFRLNSGSGSGDVLFYVPYSAFAGHTTDWLYVWGQYGLTGIVANGAIGCNGSNVSNVGTKDCQYSSSDGFEEWARLEGPGGPVPEPLTSALVGGGLISLYLLRRRSRKA